MMKQIAIFASGEGSNARKIIEHFASPPSSRNIGTSSLLAERGAKVSLIVSNNPNAGVLNIADEHKISTLIIDKEKFSNGNGYTDELKAAGIDLVVLAGFLWKIPSSLIKAFPQKIINIHPALLPKYGGKGMYGHFVHEAVIANREKESGITIHFVDEIYDHGQIIMQATCMIDDTDTPETLARKVQVLEHRHFPATIALLSTL